MKSFIVALVLVAATQVPVKEPRRDVRQQRVTATGCLQGGALKVRTFQGVPGGPAWLKLNGAKVKWRLRHYGLEKTVVEVTGTIDASRARRTGAIATKKRGRTTVTVGGVEEHAGAAPAVEPDTINVESIRLLDERCPG